MNKVLTSLALAGAVASSAAMAADDKDVWYFNPAVGYQIFDSDTGLDEAGTGILGVEYRINTHWGVELSADYAKPDNEDDIQGLDAEVFGGSLSGVYYFTQQGAWLPYAAAGVGVKTLEYDNNTDDEYTQLNAGMGVRSFLTDRWSVRGDVRYLYGTDDSYQGGLVSLGLSYLFGAEGEQAGTDQDGDGVMDRKDDCPNTPPGVAVDANGCPLDRDGDGVPNYRDKCPNTEPGVKVDEMGCTFVLSQTQSVKLNVLFAVDSSVIPAAYRSELAKVAEFMKANDGVKGVIEGHTDNTGTDAYNQALSQRRADSVRNALIKDYGIAANRLSAVGFGEQRPIADNSTAEGRQKNRRVVAVVQTQAAE
ncbi:OmpA family protein [Spongiibacter nanhainus]|uniref:OmpA family protein n=1 Tax=Spongiibacter nanhainus TaxID=2794344 RepID=A0A7T4QZI2_9GAMM|nr:OmpA family protein [Spongiibacter nanhainus]QQD17610.1 OmpA family protein [Spongiibacter nanhainus]